MMLHRGFPRHAEADPRAGWAGTGRGRGRGTQLHLQGKGGQYMGMLGQQVMPPWEMAQSRLNMNWEGQRTSGPTPWPSKGNWAMGDWGGEREWDVAGWDEEDWEEWPDDDSDWQESLHMRPPYSKKGKPKGAWQDTSSTFSSRAMSHWQYLGKGEPNSHGRPNVPRGGRFPGSRNESGTESETRPPNMKWAKKEPRPAVQEWPTLGPKNEQAEAVAESVLRSADEFTTLDEMSTTGGAAASVDVRPVTEEALTSGGEGKMSETAARAARAARLAAEAAAAAAAAAASAGLSNALSSQLEVEDSAGQADDECPGPAEVPRGARELPDPDESDLELSTARRGRWMANSNKVSESEDAMPTGPPVTVGHPRPKAKPRDDLQGGARRRSPDRGRNFPQRPPGNFPQRRQQHEQTQMPHRHEPMPRLHEVQKVPPQQVKQMKQDFSYDLQRSDFFPCNILKVLHREVFIFSEFQQASQAGPCVRRVDALLKHAQQANLRLEGSLFAMIAETCGRLGQSDLLQTVCTHASSRLWSYTGQEVADLASAAAQLGQFDRGFWSAIVVFCATPKPEAFVDLHEISNATTAMLLAAKAHAEGVDHALALHGLATAALVQLVQGDAPICDVAEFAHSLSHALTVRPLSGGEPLHATPVVEDAICQSIMQVRSELHCASAKDVAMITAAIAAAWAHMKQMRDTEFRPALQDIAQAARFRRYEYTPQDLAIIANSFAKTSFADVSLTDVLNEQTWSNISAFSTRDLCLVLLAATRVKDWAEEPFTANVAAEITVRDLGAFSVQELCTLAYALAKLPHLGPVPINRIANEAFHRQLWLFAPRDKTALVWSLAVVETQHSQQQAQLCQLIIRSLAKTDLSTLDAEQANELLWVVGKIGYSAPDPDGLVDLLLRRLIDLKPWMSKVPKHVACAAWALASVRGHIVDEVPVWDSLFAEASKLEPDSLTVPELCMLLKAAASGHGKHIVICRNLIFFLVENLAHRAHIPARGEPPRSGSEELKHEDLQGLADEFHKNHRILPPALQEMLNKAHQSDPPASSSGGATTTSRTASRAASWHRARRRHHSTEPPHDAGGSQAHKNYGHGQFGRDVYASDVEGVVHATSGSEWENYTAPRRRMASPAWNSGEMPRQYPAGASRRRGRDSRTRSWGPHMRDMSNMQGEMMDPGMQSAWASHPFYSQMAGSMTDAWMMQMAGSMYSGYGMGDVGMDGAADEWKAPGYWGPVASGFGNPYGGESLTMFRRAEGGPQVESVISAPDWRHYASTDEGVSPDLISSTMPSPTVDEAQQGAAPRQDRGRSQGRDESDDDKGRTESPIRRLASLSLVKDDKLRLNAHCPPGHNVLVRNTFLHVDVPGMADGEDDTPAPLTRSRSCDQLALLSNVPIRSLLDEPIEFQTHPSPQDRGTAMQRSPSEHAPRLQKSGTKAPPGLRRRRGEVQQTAGSGSRGVGLLSSAPPTGDRGGKVDQKARRPEEGTDKDKAEGGKRRGLMPSWMLGGRNRSVSLDRKEGKPTLSRATAGSSQVGIAKAAAIISGNALAQRGRSGQQASDGSPGRTGRMPPGRLPEKKHQAPQNAALHRRLEGMSMRELQVLAQQFHVPTAGPDHLEMVFRLSAAISDVDLGTLKTRLAELKVDVSQPMDKDQLEVRLVECIRSRMPPKPSRPEATIVQGANGPCLRLEWEVPAVEPKICATSVKLRTPPAGKYQLFDSLTGKLLAKGGSAVSAPMNTAVVQGIELGIDYEAVIAFHNGAGWGESSEPSVPTCVGEKLTASKPHTPDVPVLSEVGVPGSDDTKLKVTWKIPESWPPVEVCSVQVTEIDTGTMGFVDADNCQIVSRGGAAIAVPQCEVVIQNAEPLTRYAARIFVKSALGFGEPSPACAPYLFRGLNESTNSQNTGVVASAATTSTSVEPSQPVTEPATEPAQSGDSGGTGEGEGGQADKTEEPGSGGDNGGTGESGGGDDGDAVTKEAETGAATSTTEAAAPVDAWSDDGAPFQ